MATPAPVASLHTAADEAANANRLTLANDTADPLESL
jgi:hypothetical protein